MVLRLEHAPSLAIGPAAATWRGRAIRGRPREWVARPAIATEPQISGQGDVLSAKFKAAAITRCGAKTAQLAGGVGDPTPEIGFDGKIILTRCSEPQVTPRTSFTTFIVDDLRANREIQSTWRGLWSEGDTVSDLETKIRANNPVIPTGAKLRFNWRGHRASAARGGRGAAVCISLGSASKLTGRERGMPRGTEKTLETVSLEKIVREVGSVSRKSVIPSVASFFGVFGATACLNRPLIRLKWP